MGNIAVEKYELAAGGDKATLRRSRSNPDLQYLNVVDYIHDRLRDRGWKLSGADPTVSRPLVTPQHQCREGTSLKDVPKVDHLLKYTRTVAALTLSVMLDVPLLELKGVFSKKCYQSLRDSTFCCIANAILSIFDTEDFERIQNRKNFMLEYKKIASCIDEFKNGEEKTLDFDSFFSLREHDVFCILERYEIRKARPNFQGSPWHYDLRIPIDNIYASDLDLAKGVIQNFVPLKRNDRVQLALELMFQKGFHVYDTLAIRVLAGILYDAPYAEDSIKSSEHKLLKYELDMAGTRAWFLVGVVRALSVLVEIKSSALENFQRALIYPVTSSGCYGPCHEDVIEVIAFADFGRRLEGLRFISMRHLLFSLSLSPVGRWVKRLLNGEGQVHIACGLSEMSLLRILEKSREIAASSGRKPASEDAIDLTLDDVVLAIFPQQHALKDEVKKTISAINDEEWDAGLLNCLGLNDCYTLRDAQIWKTLTRSSEDPRGLALGLASRFFITETMMKRKDYTVYTLSDFI